MHGDGDCCATLRSEDESTLTFGGLVKAFDSAALLAPDRLADGDGDDRWGCSSC